ncbi:MAG: DNA cytosine methyltransferase [Gammaproteobacteria bacterium]|nr:DNA cytosine methyltransferase [Gammaproteobacteria bacterium]
MKLPAVSLFSGAGGLDLGVNKAGFKTLCSVELDPHCAATLQQNARAKTIWQVDVRVLDTSRVASILNIRRKDLVLLHGDPPWETAARISHEPNTPQLREALAFEMVRFARALQPTAVMIVQGPNFLKLSHSPDSLLKDVLAERFREIGYDMHEAVLDAVDYSIPQRRRQVFIICVPQGQEYEFPFKVLLPEPVNAGEAIKDLPPPAKNGGEPKVPNHVDVTPARDSDRIAYVKEGEWLAKSNAPPEVIRKLTRKDSAKYRRLDRELPSPTLRRGEILYHPVKNRYLTPRETARLQGFDDHYEFRGPIRRLFGWVSDLDQHRQVANAVPPPLAQVVATSLRKSLAL